MAQRRMFSKDITENDAFLDMPLSTQALYFHLGMQADDDGFVSPNRILRMLGGQPDDLKLLIAKKFVLQFEDGVVVIKHWKMNNYLRNDRYKTTTHQDKLAQLKVKDNGGYQLDTTGIPLVDAGKVRIGKDRLGKASKRDSRFTPPSLQEVKEYILEQNYQVDAENWHDFYTSNGWMVGKNKMKNWQATIRRWEKTETKDNPKINPEYAESAQQYREEHLKTYGVYPSN